MRGTNRLRVLRWAVPVAAVAALALAASGVFTAAADPPLPPKTAAALLVDLQHPNLDGLSGTVVQKSDLGLPLPAAPANMRGETLATLLTGSHTLRVWNSGVTKQRLALLDMLGESDAVRDGPDLWLWSSSTHTATHYRLPAMDKTDTEPPAPVGLTPQQAADAALKAIDPTTVVSTDGTSSVAGRAAYELVLSPRDTRSLIGQVRLAVDAQTQLPLRVQVYGRNTGAGPAFEVGFTRISYDRPGDEQFRFTPPPGVTVKEGSLSELTGRAGRPDAYPQPGKPAQPGNPAQPGKPAPPGRPGLSGTPTPPDGRLDGTAAPRTVGTGWTTVVVIPSVRQPTGQSGGRLSGQGVGGQLAELLDRLPRVSGAWGSGRLLTSTLVSALLTDDGRLLVGPVTPDLLYAAAGHR
jgi:outer membrane lipoprotein-sorting protein